MGIEPEEARAQYDTIRDGFARQAEDRIAKDRGSSQPYLSLVLPAGASGQSARSLDLFTEPQWPLSECRTLRHEGLVSGRQRKSEGTSLNSRYVPRLDAPLGVAAIDARYVPPVAHFRAEGPSGLSIGVQT